MLKRILAVTAMTIFCVSAAACGGETASPAATPATQSTAATSTTVTSEVTPFVEVLPLSLGTPYTAPTVSFSLVKVQTDDKVTASVDDAVYYGNEHEGRTYVDVVLDVTNLSSEAVPSHQLLSVRASGAEEYRSVLFATETAHGTELVQYEDVAPNATVRLHAAVDIPETETDLVLHVSVKDTDYTMAYTVGERLYTAKTLSVGDSVTEKEFGTLTLVGVNYGDRVDPADTTGYYSYYIVKDPNHSYLSVVTTITSTETAAVPVAAMLGATVYYPDGGVYTGFAVTEAEDHKSFKTDGEIAPNETVQVIYLIEVPKVTERTEAELVMSFGTKEYTTLVAIPAVETTTTAAAE